MRDLIPRETRDLLQRLEDRGQISIPALREVHRASQHQERVYQRPNETVFETTDTTIEIYYFE